MMSRGGGVLDWATNHGSLWSRQIQTSRLHKAADEDDRQNGENSATKGNGSQDREGIDKTGEFSAIFGRADGPSLMMERTAYTDDKERTRIGSEGWRK